MSEEVGPSPLPEHPLFAAYDKLDAEHPDMSPEERIPRLNALAREYRERVIREGTWVTDNRVSADGGWPFELGADQARAERILAYLNAAYTPGQRGPWTRFTCSGGDARHDTGAEARLVRDIGGEWKVEPRTSGGSRPTIYGAWNGYRDEGGYLVRVESPERLELTCPAPACGHPLYRRPDALSVAMVEELVKYRQGKDRGKNYQPRVSWS